MEGTTRSDPPLRVSTHLRRAALCALNAFEHLMQHRLWPTNHPPHLKTRSLLAKTSQGVVK